MSLVSIRLPGELESRLASEAERTQRAKSDIAREAIIQYLDRTERERFREEIARASRSSDDGEALTAAEEALPSDNEALSITEGSSVREAAPRYRKRGKRKKKR